MHYFVVIEKGEAAQSFGAYVPDLPGCVATGSTRKQVRTRIRSAIVMHLEGMREDGIRPPKPSMPEFCEIAIAFSRSAAMPPHFPIVVRRG